MTNSHEDELHAASDARDAALMPAPISHASTPAGRAGHVKDEVSIGVRAVPRQPPSRRARVHLLLGPVGAGKSTFALRLAEQHAALRFNLDEWMALLFRPDRPEQGLMQWYVERAARCVEQIVNVATAALALETDVILEIGLLRREERRDFYRRIDAAGCELRVYVLDAPRAVRWQRVERRNRDHGATFVMMVPEAIFELASDLWEPLQLDEQEGRDVVFVDSDVRAR